MGSTKIQKQDLDMDGLASAIQTLMEQGVIEVGGMPTVIKAGKLSIAAKMNESATGSLTGKGTVYIYYDNFSKVIKLVVDGTTVHDSTTNLIGVKNDLTVLGLPIHFSESVQITVTTGANASNNTLYLDYTLYE